MESEMEAEMYKGAVGRSYARAYIVRIWIQGIEYYM